MEEAGTREFLEETGYRCGELKWITTFQHPSDDGKITFELTLYSCQYDGLQSVHCYEGQEVRFILRAEADRFPIPSYLIPIWDKALTAEKKASTHPLSSN